MLKTMKKKTRQIHCAHPDCKQRVHFKPYEDDGLYYVLIDGIPRMVHKACFLNILNKEEQEDDLVKIEIPISAP